MADLGEVLDAVGADSPVLGGQLEGGAMNVLFAATFPDRLRSLFWWYPSPRSTHADDYPWGGNEHDLEKWMQDIVENWGTASYNDPDDPSVPWDCCRDSPRRPTSRSSTS